MKLVPRAHRFHAGLLAGALSLLAPHVRAELPTLEVAIQRAREHALVVAEAQGEVGVANAHMTGARVSSVGNPYTDIQVDRPFSSYSTAGREIQALTYTYIPIDIGGQRGKRVAEASALVDWKKRGLVDARGLATGQVVAAYGELVVGYARIAQANAGESSARDEAKYFEGRFEAKDTTLYEKSIAEAEVARWVQSRVEAELRVTDARARFGQLTGLKNIEGKPPETPIAPPTLRTSWGDAHVGEVADKAPLVARFLAERNYWEASVARYEREVIPPVSFEIIAGRGGSGEARFGAGAMITFPITRRFQGEIARAEQGRLLASRQVDLYRNVVVTRLRAARDAIQSIDKALEELDKSGIPALEQAVTASVDAFHSGKVDLSRAMLARRDLAIARARRLDLVEAAWRAYADLVIFTGELP